MEKVKLNRWPFERQAFIFFANFAAEFIKKFTPLC
jgi:hypothetical protein